MAYKDANPPALPPYFPMKTPGVRVPNIFAVQRGSGSLVPSFSTSQAFTVEQYAAARGLPLDIAQAVLDQAVADGYIVIV